MSNSSGVHPATIHVLSAGGPVRISLLDHRFQLVGAPSIGEFVKQDAAPGLYLLQYDAGLTSRDVPIRLEAGAAYQDLNVRVPFSSAAPLPGSTGYHKEQAAAAEELSRRPGTPAGGAIGEGARLMVFARSAEPGAAAPSLAGLALLNEHLKPLVDPFSSNRDDWDGWEGWCADVRPGAYALRWPGRGAAAVEQALWAPKGWTTILFLAGDGGDPPRLQDASVQLTRMATGFVPFRQEAAEVQRAAELALAGWRTGKPLVDPASLVRLSTGEFGNPMLGVVGAHILLRQPKPDSDLLAAVLAALGAPDLIPGHPDLRALRAAVRARFKQAEAPELLDYPPMFEASFREAIASDWGRFDVISPGGLAGRVAPRLVPLSPWTTWPTALDEAACSPPADADATADFLGDWLRRVLPQLSLANRVVRVFGFDWGAAAPRELWGRFAGSNDPAVRKLADQLRAIYRFAEKQGGADALKEMRLDGLAQSLGLPQASVAAAAMELARDLLALRPPEGVHAAVRAEKEAEAWPPPNGTRFIRGEAFGRLLLGVVAELAAKYPARDFTDGAAQVFAWFDGKLKQNRRFINGRRFPTEAAFRAYLRQAVWNAARMAERRRRKGKEVQALPAGQSLVSSAPGPEQLAALHESVQALEPRYRDILELLFFKALDVDQTASSLGLTRREVVRLYEEAIDQLPRP